MKTFEDELKRAIDNAPFTPGLDDGRYNDGVIDGLERALQLIDKHKDDAINEILTEYHEWAINISAESFDRWQVEEGDHEKTNARIKKEFIEYLNQKG